MCKAVLSVDETCREDKKEPSAKINKGEDREAWRLVKYLRIAATGHVLSTVAPM